MADSSPLFVPFATPPLKTLGDEVIALVAQARKVQTLNAVVENFIKVHHDVFFSVFSRQIELITSRPQALKEGQVTIFDKALLILIAEPDALQNPAAVNFFCEEFLNLDTGGPISELSRALHKAFHIPTSPKQASPDAPDTTAGATEVDGPGKKAPGLGPMDPSLPKDMEHRLAVMWSVYELARVDYLVALNQSDKEKLIANAKFLRDTAENILLYIENKTVDALMVTELNATFTHAKATVVCLTGGKSRKFDTAEIEKVMGVPRGPSQPNRNNKGFPPLLTAAKLPHHQEYLGHLGATAAATSIRFSSFDHGKSTYDHPGRPRHSDPKPRRERSSHRDELQVDKDRNRDRRSGHNDAAYVYELNPAGTEESRRHHGYDDVAGQSRGRASGTENTRQPTPPDSVRRREDRSASPAPSRARDRSHNHAARRRRSRSLSYDSRNYRPSLGGRSSARHTDHYGAYVSTERGAFSNGGGRKAGRGHSGVPFGYAPDRPVDSYVPRYDRKSSEDESMGDSDF